MSETETPSRRTPAAIAVGIVTLVAIAAVTSAMVAARLLPAQAEDEEARPVAVGETVEGNLGGRPDRWVLTGSSNETVVIEMHRRGGGLDPYLHLVDPNGLLVAEDDDGAGDLNSRIRHTFADDGEYTIHASGLSGSRGTYTLSVRAPRDRS